MEEMEPRAWAAWSRRWGDGQGGGSGGGGGPYGDGMVEFSWVVGRSSGSVYVESGGAWDNGFAWLLDGLGALGPVRRQDCEWIGFRPCS